MPAPGGRVLGFSGRTVGEQLVQKTGVGPKNPQGLFGLVLFGLIGFASVFFLFDFCGFAVFGWLFGPVI